MLNVRMRLLFGALVFIGLAGCGNKAKKMSLSKGNQGKGQVTEWTTDKEAFSKLMGKDEKGKPTCFQLPALLNLITGVGDDLVSIYASDLDFVDITGGEEDSTNAPRSEPVSGDVTAQKAAYFFKGRSKEKFYEVEAGKAIVGSFQIGELVAIGGQDGCTAVTFMGANQSVSRFNISSSGNVRNTNSIRLTGVSSDVLGERRTYALLNRGQILMTVSKVVRDVPTCGLFPKSRRIQKSYIITRGNQQGQAMLTSNFARFLDNAVYSVPELKSQLDKKSDKDKPKTQEKVTPRSAFLSDRIAVSYPTLTYLAMLINVEQGKLKDNNCKP